MFKDRDGYDTAACREAAESVTSTYCYFATCELPHADRIYIEKDFSVNDGHMPYHLPFLTSYRQ
jgi:hypothetical protein